MPKNKDLKRLVRSRMQKTGEAYTTARLHVLAGRRSRAPTAELPPPPPADQPERAPGAYERVAGVKDATVQARTGCTWRKWVGALDYAGAARMTHAQIARYVRTKFGLGSWWAQTVTVGYERIRGRRAVHQRAGGFAVTKSRTFHAPLAALAAAFASPARNAWLGDQPARPRKSVAGKVARWTNADGSKVDVNFWPKAADRTQAQLQHAGLPDAAAVARWRAFWTERFAALAAWLAARGHGTAGPVRPSR